jgi:tetratricopeptide (TPR) repeat protein
MFADTPGPHPAYLHSLTDLRAARGYLDKLGPDDAVDNDSMRAIQEIDAAINEIKRASIDDHKDLHDHPAVDVHLARTDRFHKALELLDKAHNDVARAEADEGARGLRDRAVHHIDEAKGSVDAALRAVSQFDHKGKHPSYLHALTDLRSARGYLDKLGSDDAVDNDSMQAIRQIDAAIGEIKKASIDDGKDLRDHPPIDAHVKRTDRFHKAIELLDKAHNDVNEEEDDPAARGLKASALQHIADAHHAIDHAISAALN